MINFISNVHNKLKGYRTVIWATLSALPGAYLTFYDSFKDMGLDVTPFFTTVSAEKWLPLFVLANGIVVILIRLDTKGKIGDKSVHDGDH